MSDILGIGSSAISAYRNALAAVGSNVANAQTKGYVRRGAVLRELPLASGVAGNRIARSADAFASAAVRTATTRSALADTATGWLGRVEAALDSGDGGVGASLSRFFATATRLAGDPGSTTLRSGFIDALEDVAAGLNRTAAALADVGVAASLAQNDAIAAINGDLAALAAVNVTLRTEPQGTAARASIEDERDRLLGTLAGGLRIDCAFAADGTVSITPADTPEPPLLDAAGAARLEMIDGGTGSATLYITHPAGTRSLGAPGGTLGGLAEARAAVDRRAADLDTLAVDFSTALNAWSAAGRTPAGGNGPVLLTGGSGATITLAAALAPGDVAAASSTSSNGNALALADVRQANGFEARWNGLVSANAGALAGKRREAEAAALASETAIAARDAVSRVDLDSEAADLLALQQGYNASARVLQVARETIDTLLTRL